MIARGHVLALAIGAVPMVARAAPASIDPLNQILVQRGIAAMALGDISGARLLLEPPAAAGIPTAEYHLAETYDPVWLVKHHATNIDSLAKPLTAIKLYYAAAKQGDEQAAAHVARTDK